MHSSVDYTLYEGKHVRGLPETVTLRGSVIVDNRQFIGHAGGGHFIPRKPYSGAI
jgi:dihydropyrimidinase